MRKKYVVDLTPDEQTHLHALLSQGKVAARTLRRAQVLLLAAADQRDAVIAATLHVGRATGERTRKRFVEGGLPAALTEQPRPGRAAKLRGTHEAFLIALACSTPPRGRERWPMQLLAQRSVAVGRVDTISDETVRRTLKKTLSNPG
jgi:transposase